MDYIKFLYLFFLGLLIGCTKDQPPLNEDISTIHGILILNEGLFQQNNSSVTWINLVDETISNSIFESLNGRPLGDTGNDIKRYGSKIYIVMNGSSTIEVLNAHNFQSIKQIPLILNQQGQSPRSIAFSGQNAYVASYDGYINVIDTVSLIVTNRLAVGNNPEEVITHNNFLYVSNSGGLNYPIFDSTVYQIDLNNLAITDTFNIGANPGEISIDTEGNLYVIKRGDYGSDPSELIYVNTNSGEVTNLQIPVSTIFKKGQNLFIGNFDFNSSQSQIGLYDLESKQLISNTIIDATEIATLYGIYVDDNDNLICLDAQGFTNSGFLKIFDMNGVLKKSFEVGLNPNHLLYYE